MREKQEGQTTFFLLRCYLLLHDKSDLSPMYYKTVVGLELFQKAKIILLSLVRGNLLYNYYRTIKMTLHSLLIKVVSVFFHPFNSFETNPFISTPKIFDNTIKYFSKLSAMIFLDDIRIIKSLNSLNLRST
jgi:hypothetical protein